MDDFVCSPIAPSPTLPMHNKVFRLSCPVHCMQSLDGIPKVRVSGGGASRRLPHNGRLQELLSSASSSVGGSLSRWVAYLYAADACWWDIPPQSMQPLMPCSCGAGCARASLLPGSGCQTCRTPSAAHSPPSGSAYISAGTSSCETAAACTQAPNRTNLWRGRAASHGTCLTIPSTRLSLFSFWTGLHLHALF